MRKKHDERLNEILDAAQQLFIQKGYEETTVNDILDAVEIGKGTFYHYFTSKEGVMDAVIDRMVQSVVTTAQAGAADNTLPAHEKMRRVILSLNISGSPNEGIIEELHRPSNAKLHRSNIIATLKAVAPILAGVVEQGIREGIYSTPYPLETMEILLAANHSIFDDGDFSWEPEALQTRAAAFVRMIELALGAEKGSFHFLLEALTPTSEENSHGE